MDLQILYDEINNDPLNRGYMDMTDVEVMADLNTAYRSRHVEELTGDAMFQATDAAEFGNLTDHKQLLWVTFTNRGIVDPWNAKNVSFVQYVFGSDSATISALADLRSEEITRAEELGLGTVTEADIAAAREWENV